MPDSGFTPVYHISYRAPAGPGGSRFIPFVVIRGLYGIKKFFVIQVFHGADFFTVLHQDFLRLQKRRITRRWPRLNLSVLVSIQPFVVNRGIQGILV